MAFHLCLALFYKDFKIAYQLGILLSADDRKSDKQIGFLLSRESGGGSWGQFSRSTVSQQGPGDFFDGSLMLMTHGCKMAAQLQASHLYSMWKEGRRDSMSSICPFIRYQKLS